jgi:uncharacterized metal-binding protein
MGDSAQNTPSVPASTESPAAGDVVFACSGCSDAGELADRIARRLRDASLAEMGCLAGVGGRVKPLLRKAQEARRILVLDGCPHECASATLRGAGIEDIIPIRLHDLGLRKGRCPVSEGRIELGVVAATAALKREPCRQPDSQSK